MLDPVTTAGAAGLAALIRPVLETLVEHAAGKVDELATHLGGHILHEKYREAARHVRERIPGFSGLPANHDVRQAVRLAQLQALEYVLNDYDKSNPPEWQADPVNKPKWFLETALRFVRSQRPLRGEIKTKGSPEQTRAIEATERSIVEALASSRPPQAGNDEPLHELADASPPPPQSDSDERLRVLAEDAVLDELKLKLDGIVLPEDFQRRFRGKAPPATGWFGAFTIYLAEQVKTNDRFHKILVTDLLADLTRLGLATQDIVRALDATIGDMSAGLVRIEGKIGEMEDANERRHRETLALLRQIPGIAKAKGVEEAPLRAVLKKLGEAEVPVAEIPRYLDKAADELIQLRADLARLRNDRPEFAAIRARASALIDRGELDAARAELRKGREAARALREESSRSEAGFLLDEARVDRLQLNYDDACAKFAEASRLDPDNCWIWIDLGDLWMIRGSLAEGKSPFATRSMPPAEAVTSATCRRLTSTWATCWWRRAICRRR